MALTDSMIFPTPLQVVSGTLELAADRILVLSPRPATIQATFAVNQAHPRKLSSPALQQLKDAILTGLGLEI